MARLASAASVQDAPQFVVVFHTGRHDDLGVVFRHVALRQLRVGEVPVPDQFVGARPRDAGDVERDARMLEHREMPDVDDVPQIAGVGRGLGIGLGPALVARPAGELDQRLATVGVGAPRHVGRRDELGLGDQLHVQRRGLGHGEHPSPVTMRAGTARWSGSGAANRAGLGARLAISACRGCHARRRRRLTTATRQTNAGCSRRIGESDKAVDLEEAHGDNEIGLARGQRPVQQPRGNAHQPRPSPRHRREGQVRARYHLPGHANRFR